MSICQINRTLTVIYNLFIRFYNVNINTHNSKNNEYDHAKKAVMSENTGKTVQLRNNTTVKVVLYTRDSDDLESPFRF